MRVAILAKQSRANRRPNPLISIPKPYTYKYESESACFCSGVIVYYNTRGVTQPNISEIDMYRSNHSLSRRAAIVTAVVAIFLGSGWMFAYSQEAELPQGIVEVGPLTAVEAPATAALL